MGNWQEMMRTRARHGSFVGRGSRDEDSYFEFFAGSDLDREIHRSITVARSAPMTYLHDLLKMVHAVSAAKLLRFQR